MKYRKKPVVIEAFRIEPHGIIPEWFMAAVKRGDALPTTDDPSYIMHADWPCIIRTLHGGVEAMPGDWIVKGIKGDLYPVKPDTFEATYEKVTSAAELEVSMEAINKTFNRIHADV